MDYSYMITMITLVIWLDTHLVNMSQIFFLRLKRSRVKCRLSRTTNLFDLRINNYKVDHVKISKIKQVNKLYYDKRHMHPILSGKTCIFNMSKTPLIIQLHLLFGEQALHV